MKRANVRDTVAIQNMENRRKSQNNSNKFQKFKIQLPLD